MSLCDLIVWPGTGTDCGQTAHYGISVRLGTGPRKTFYACTPHHAERLRDDLIRTGLFTIEGEWWPLDPAAGQSD